MNNDWKHFSFHKVDDLSSPYSPQSKKVFGRLNNSIGEVIRAILLTLNVKRLWTKGADM